MNRSEKTPLDYAKTAADAIIRQSPVEELPPKNRFCQRQGILLSGMEKVYHLSDDKKYYDYIKNWVDYYIDEKGSVRFDSTVRQFDQMQPAVLLFNLYKDTKDERYKKVLDDFALLVEMWPTNARGGFWHNYDLPNQMRLDLLYMIGPYTAMYASCFDKPYFYEKIFRQIDLMRRNMTNPKTGLLYHSWDDSRIKDWADKETGLSPESWGRTIGWYAAAVMDILDYIPGGHPRRHEIASAGVDIINALVRFQDEGSGLWFQVVDKGSEPGNWLENSCSLLFTYAIAKAVNKGLLHKSYANYAHRAYSGIIKTLRFEGDDFFIPNLCLSTEVGDYQYYINREKAENDLYGIGAFLMVCSEYNKIKGV